MILSDRDIRLYVKKGKIKLEPEPDWEVSLGSCSVDLRLGEVDASFSKRGVSRSESPRFLLQPGKFVLAATLESVEMPTDLCGMLHGRSSIGRRGIMVHSTAAMIDAGFRGKIVLELFNAGAQVVELKVGERICAISFEKLTSPAEVPYYKKKRAKYLSQDKPQV